MYIYTATIYKNTEGIINLNVSQEQANKSDFETNYKSSAIPITEVVIAQTAFITDLTYSAFKAKIVSPVLWSDVKYIENGKYILYLSTENPI